MRNARPVVKQVSPILTKEWMKALEELFLENWSLAAAKREKEYENFWSCMRYYDVKVMAQLFDKVDITEVLQKFPDLFVRL